jgi:spore germination cell wall hydrolase CwlJ-like protein
MIASMCLALALYHEARGEPHYGQLMVARVIVNRVQSKNFPDSVCDVVMQPRQFSFVKKGKFPKAKDLDAWRVSQDLADQVIKDVRVLPYSMADHYHTVKVSPVWNKDLYKVTQVGGHIFYSRNHPYAFLGKIRPKSRPEALVKPEQFAFMRWFGLL